MGDGPGDLHALALEFLNACVAALETIPDYEPLGGAPLRYFVAPGPPAFDCCDQLAVHVAPISERTNTVGAQINQVALTVFITRCVPMPNDDGTPPDPGEQQAAAEQINADKWALWNYLHLAIEDGLLFDRCCGVNWGQLTPLTPSGGCGGSQLTLTVCFDGYEAVIST
jgi:hypothetical protein